MAVDERYPQSAFIKGCFEDGCTRHGFSKLLSSKNRRLRNMTGALNRLYIVSAEAPRSANMRYANEENLAHNSVLAPQGNVGQTQFSFTNFRRSLT